MICPGDIEKQKNHHLKRMCRQFPTIIIFEDPVGFESNCNLVFVVVIFVFCFFFTTTHLKFRELLLVLGCNDSVFIYMLRVISNGNSTFDIKFGLLFNLRLCRYVNNNLATLALQLPFVLSLLNGDALKMFWDFVADMSKIECLICL